MHNQKLSSGCQKNLDSLYHLHSQKIDFDDNRTVKKWYSQIYNVGICKYQHSKFNDLDHALVSRTLQLDKLKRIE